MDIKLTEKQAVALRFINGCFGANDWDVGKAVNPKSQSTWRSGAVICGHLRRKGLIRWAYKDGWVATDKGKAAARASQPLRGGEARPRRES